MAPGGNYRSMSTISEPRIIAYTSADSDTSGTANPVMKCKCCGQEIKNRYVYTSTPTREKSFFDLEKQSRHQPQDLNKTHHWKRKNTPKF